ncbi:hypothetical protein ACN47E_003442 [Coniothyrium glycines]
MPAFDPDPAATRATALPAQASSAPSTTSAKFRPRGLSEREIIVIGATIGSVVLFVIVTAVVHCIRKHRRMKAEEKRRADIEGTLRRAQPPKLTLNTDVIRPRKLQKPESATLAPTSMMGGGGMIAGPSNTAVFSASEPRYTTAVHGGVVSPLSAGFTGVAPGTSTESTRGTLHEGDARLPRFYEMDVHRPKQFYDPQTRRTIYLG